MADRVRLMPRRSELGSTDRFAAAVPAEPELVAEDVQAQLTHRSHANAAEQRRASLDATRDALRRQADYHAAQLRHAERELARVERRLGR